MPPILPLGKLIVKNPALSGGTPRHMFSKITLSSGYYTPSSTSAYQYFYKRQYISLLQKNRTQSIVFTAEQQKTIY